MSDVKANPWTEDAGPVCDEPGTPCPDRAARRTVFTLGTDRRTEEDFIEILAGYEVTAVVDVRRFPESKIETFRREHLEELLRREGIGYHYLGGELGGFRKGGYEAYTLTDAFRAGIERVEAIAGRFRSAILCAERFPWKCHRKWIARDLARRGWSVAHIIDKGRVWQPGASRRGASRDSTPSLES